ncbi:lipoprotein [Mycoplasmopsis californica]|uniref:Lipoprotein n=1 Tax=Mycoplasmopsis californica TaxID=2113 RepID=A0A059XW77_9BACT|nr:P80 family lipoprotein [Mycoplasmopsis californica]AIA29581.1 lipoprotein [Mycoplasmopsis californica]
MKKNKIILPFMSLAGVTTMTAPLIAASCGKQEENTVKVGVTFSQGKEQWNALEGVINKYNEKVAEEKIKAKQEIKTLKTRLETEKDKAKKEELKKQIDENQNKIDNVLLRVELKNIGSGYSAGHNYVVSALENNDTSNIPSITVNYGSTISEIIRFKKGVNLADPKFGENKIERSKFEERFTAVNDRIQGIAPGANYSIPLLKSTVAFGINGPIYKYVLQTLKKAGYTIDSELTKDFKLDDESWKDDISVISSDDYFGKAKDKKEIEKIFTTEKYPNKEIKKSIFQEFKTFIKFITDAIKIFEKSSVPGSTVALLGIDDPSGILNTVIYSKFNGDDKKMLMAVDKDGEGKTIVKFDQLNNGSDAYKAHKEMYELLLEAVKAGALKIYGGGSYSSTDEVNHKVGANFGSTAGYTHNFVSDKEFKPYIQFFDNANKPIAIIENDNVGQITNKDNKKQIKFKYPNAYVASNSKLEKGYYFKTAKNDDALIEKLNALKDTDYIIRVNSKPKDKDTNGKAQLDNIEKLANEADSPVKKLGVISEYKDTKVQTVWNIYSFDTTPKTIENKYKVATRSPKDTLQESELVAYRTPKKYDASSLKDTAFLQGPNLYVIDKGERLNKAAMRFLSYVINNNQKTTFNHGEDQSIETTNLGYISFKASYIIPYKNFDKSDDLKKVIEKNKYLKIAFDLFADKNTTWYEEPASKFSAPYRDQFNSAYKAAAQTIRDKWGKSLTEAEKKSTSFETIVGLLNDEAQTFKS